jgi:predicted ester cyclase
VGHVVGSPEVKGSEALKQRLTMLHTAFPDIHITVDDMVAAGDKVATRTTLHGTHKGKFLGIAPTGKTITATDIRITRIANGKLRENWLAGDLHQQLGGGPKMAKPAKKK